MSRVGGGQGASVDCHMGKQEFLPRFIAGKAAGGSVGVWLGFRVQYRMSGPCGPEGSFHGSCRRGCCGLRPGVNMAW